MRDIMEDITIKEAYDTFAKREETSSMFDKLLGFLDEFSKKIIHCIKKNVGLINANAVSIERLEERIKKLEDLHEKR